MRRNEKGITLVALVVTIIVLLILAGVSLSLVAGGNGILTRATNASAKSEQATAKEQAELLVAELTTEYYEAKYANGDSTRVDGNASTVLAGIASDTARKTGDGKYNVTIKSNGTITVTGGSVGTITGTIQDTGSITSWS